MATYIDSSLNRKLNRVGLPRGSVPHSTKKSNETRAIPKIVERFYDEEEVIISYKNVFDLLLTIVGSHINSVYKLLFPKNLHL